ncbi:MAG: FAD-binding oxidoreductase [Actinobacteria bacterium]|nr:MAG: FAD-binding oxidoreductase [Actinomycetota bacterium]
MTDTADVVVIGGGVIGASAAYHLAEGGAGRVLLLERAGELGTGSTGACAGGFRHQFSSRVNILLSLASVPMITRFSEEHGLPLDVVQDGYLFLVRTNDAWRAFLAGVELQRSLGVEVEVLEPNQVGELLPGIALEGLVGATFGPKDGIADPSGLTNGYATLARRSGAEIRTGVEVQGVDTEGGRVTGVSTADGLISAGAVIDAAGPWASKVAATAGVDLPVEPIPRNVVVTGPFPGAPARRTLVIEAESTFYFHREGPGVLMGMGGRDEHASFDTRVDERFVADELLPTAVQSFPPLEAADLRFSWSGLYEMTPDRHPVIGEAPGVAGFYLANGFSGHGFQHGPIVGKLLAELIVDGAARSVDISSLGLGRFTSGHVVSEHHVV